MPLQVVVETVHAPDQPTAMHQLVVGQSIEETSSPARARSAVVQRPLTSVARQDENVGMYTPTAKHRPWAWHDTSTHETPRKVEVYTGAVQVDPLNVATRASSVMATHHVAEVQVSDRYGAAAGCGVFAAEAHDPDANRWKPLGPKDRHHPWVGQFRPMTDDAVVLSRICLGALHVAPLSTWYRPLWSTDMHQVLVGHCRSAGEPTSGSGVSWVHFMAVEAVAVTRTEALPAAVLVITS